MIARKVFAEIRVPLCASLLLAIGLAGGYFGATVLPATPPREVGINPSTSVEWAVLYSEWAITHDEFHLLSKEENQQLVEDFWGWRSEVFVSTSTPHVVRWHGLILVGFYGEPVAPRLGEYARVPLDGSEYESWVFILAWNQEASKWERVTCWRLSTSNQIAAVE